MLLLDSSVWIAAKDQRERYYGPARELAVDPEYLVAGLDLTLYEVANVLGARERRPDEAVDLCRLVTARCHRNLLAVDPELIRAGLEIAVEHGISAYDAAYVAASRRHDWTLVSADIRDLVSKGLAVTPDAAV